jgi:hypothetical protein
MRLLLLRCMSPFMARTGPPATFAIRSLLGANRTWPRQPNLVANDPDRHQDGAIFEARSR